MKKTPTARRPQTRQESVDTAPSAARLWAFGIFLACGVGLTVVFYGIFRVHRVAVVGHGLPVAMIQRVAGVNDQNVFTVQSDQVVARLAVIREIVVGRVETSFPDMVTIYAQERQPMVVWQTRTARYELDPEGYIIRPVSVSPLPVIVGVTSQRGRIEPGIIQAVRYAVHTLPGAPNGAVAMFQVTPHTGLTVVGRTGWKAVVGKGPAQLLADRIATLSALLSKLQSRGSRLQSVDLRFRTPPMRVTGP